MNKLLIVEDDVEISQKLSLILDKEGFNCFVATSEEEVSSLLEQHNFSLALVDIALPDGSGFSVFTKIQSFRKTPVIFLSAFDQEDSVVTGLELGAVDYITKPYRPRELIARIKATLRLHNHEEHVFSFADVVIETNSGVVTKKGEECYLSPLEYRLLLMFFNNPNIVLTRDRLIEELWTLSGEYITDNALTVYIKRLREKIEDDAKNPKIILTVRGIGYKLGKKDV